MVLYSYIDTYAALFSPTALTANTFRYCNVWHCVHQQFIHISSLSSIQLACCSSREISADFLSLTITFRKVNETFSFLVTPSSSHMNILFFSLASRAQSTISWNVGHTFSIWIKKYNTKSDVAHRVEKQKNSNANWAVGNRIFPKRKVAVISDSMYT